MAGQIPFTHAWGGMLEEEKRKKYWAGTLKFHSPYLVQASFGEKRTFSPTRKKEKEKVGNGGSGLFPSVTGIPPPSRDRWPYRKRNRDRLGTGWEWSLSHIWKSDYVGIS